MFCSSMYSLFDAVGAQRQLIPLLFVFFLFVVTLLRVLGAVINHCRDYLGYERVVLCGWSGGGSLAAFYQSQAESPSVRRCSNEGLSAL